MSWQCEILFLLHCDSLLWNQIHILKDCLQVFAFLESNKKTTTDKLALVYVVLHDSNFGQVKAFISMSCLKWTRFCSQRLTDATAVHLVLNAAKSSEKAASEDQGWNWKYLLSHRIEMLMPARSASSPFLSIEWLQFQRWRLLRALCRQLLATVMQH